MMNKHMWKYLEIQYMYIVYYIYIYMCVFLVVHLLSRILRWSRTFWYLPAQLLASGVPFVRLKPWRSKNLKARKTCQKRKVLGHIGIIDLKNHLRIWIQATYIMHPPSYYPLRVGGWNFVEKQGVPPKKGLYKMKSLGGHPTTKSEYRQTYVGTNFQEISRNPGLQNQNLAVRKSSCFFMFFTFASKMHIDVKWGWFCREVIL